jgi:uncharacterized protein YndB with AHSA1/START domain
MINELTLTIETPSEREVVITRTFDAPRRLVFDAFTKPELIKRWYGPPGSLEICESDARRGGSWRFVMKRNNKTVGQYGTYREVSAPDRFVRTERWEDWDPGETLVTTVLTEHAGTTTVVMRIMFPSREVRDVVLKGGLTQEGMTEFYARLDALLREHSRT